MSSDVNDEIPMRVYVWGGGGACGENAGSGNGYGGGGGGLAISEFTPVANQAYTVTIGGSTYSYNGVGGTSSFSGAGITTLSASGGRSGNNSTDPTGNSTGESSNPQTGVMGQGGVGVGDASPIVEVAEAALEAWAQATATPAVVVPLQAQLETRMVNRAGTMAETTAVPAEPQLTLKELPLHELHLVAEPGLLGVGQAVNRAAAITPTAGLEELGF